ncbi:hypothetical protein [Acinetobacter junii]|uniref:hypothetical protein n=1 Tax=Acinetobacter junii TaxID=40215 RepID=UPI001F17E17A|nr:hypothetical protein [Acinetobacter junii]
MNFKEFFLAFGVSLLIGYWFEAGRLIVEGYTFNTGYDYLSLNFDFADYVHIGFFANLLIFTPKIIYIICFLIVAFILYIYRNKLKHAEIKIEWFFILLWTKYVKKRRNIDKKALFFKCARRVLKNNLRNRRKKFPKYLLLSYFFLVFSLFGFYIILLSVLKFYERGQNSAIQDVLNQTKYITYKDKKMFKLLCGKNLCIFSDKSLSFFKLLEEKSYDIKKLNSIKNISTKDSEFTFFHLKTDMPNNNEKIIHVQINYNKNYDKIMKNYPFEFRLHVKNTLPYTSALLIEKACYRNTEDDFTKNLNNIKSTNEEPLPHFISFRIPKEKEIVAIDIFNPAEKIQSINYCK